MSLPVRWSGVPRGTVELAIFVLNLQRVHGRLFFDWALAGLSPALHGISAGTLPPARSWGATASAMRATRYARRNERAQNTPS